MSAMVSKGVAGSGLNRIVAVLAVSVAVFIMLGADRLAPHDPDARWPGLLNAPPTLVHLRDADGVWHMPFIHPWMLISQLEQRYEADGARRVPLVWLSGGRLLRSSDETQAPLLVLGADHYGRDVLSRLLTGARTSLGLALLAAFGSIGLGAAVGSLAAYFGGVTDDWLMRATDLVLVLPTMYVALALRAAMPLVLAPGVVFAVLLGIFAVMGAPTVARGVRGLLRTERALEYAAAAESIGASPARVMIRHLLPATRGFLFTQLTILVPAFIVAEATVSYVGLGFPEPVPSWGAMLHDASSVRAFADFPWLLSPAVAIFLAVLGLNLVLPRSAGPGRRD